MNCLVSSVEMTIIFDRSSSSTSTFADTVRRHVLNCQPFNKVHGCIRWRDFLLLPAIGSGRLGCRLGWLGRAGRCDGRASSEMRNVRGLAWPWILHCPHRPRKGAHVILRGQVSSSSNRRRYYRDDKRKKRDCAAAPMTCCCAFSLGILRAGKPPKTLWSVATSDRHDHDAITAGRRWGDSRRSCNGGGCKL